jgi:predicted Fe-Mo cluster-binding NifX family protein
MDKYKVAMASTDQKNVDLHFGKCDSFTIAEVDEENGNYRIVEERPVLALCSSCETDEAMDTVLRSLSDCKVVVASRIGRWPYSMLYAKGIESVEFRGSIEDALAVLRNTDLKLEA